jgi:RNA polymerase sigma-70 factor (ECF subfamily)
MGETVGLSAAASCVDEARPNQRLATLFDAHHPRLYRLARRMAPFQDEAMDLVQETFLRVARSPNSVPFGTSSEEAWLVRVLVNISRDRWRREARRRRAEERGQLNEVQLHSSSSNQESVLIARSTVWQGLWALPPRRRAVVVLHELDGVGPAEIARVLGVSVVTVRWHLSVGRRELARRLSSKQGERP